MISTQKKLIEDSWKVSMALDLLGYKPEMMKWRRLSYEKRLRSINQCVRSAQKEPDLSLPRSFCTFILTGSKEEGTSVWGGGDEDWMVVLNAVVAVKEKTDVPAESDQMVLFLDDENTKPGYTCVKKSSECEKHSSAWDTLVQTISTGNDYISSQHLNKAIYDSVRQCASVAYNSIGSDVLDPVHHFMEDDDANPKLIYEFNRGNFNNTIDMMPAFLCVNPAVTTRWYHRQRHYGWPPEGVIKRISKLHVHIVPRGLKGSASYDLQFRISYTLGEIELMKSLNETQLKLYSLLKLLFKSVKVEIVSEIITSYVLKNVLFWICEISPQERFSNDHLLELLKESLEYITKRVEENFLPNYFIPERNLLEGRLHNENRQELLDLLSDFVSDGPLVVERILALRTPLLIVKQDIALAMAISLIKNTYEIALVNDRQKTLTEEGPNTFMGYFKQAIELFLKKR